MALAFSKREIEAELRQLDTDLCRQSSRANLIEEPEIVIAHRNRSLGTGDRLTELREDQSAAARGDGGASLERVISVLARHERPRRPLYEFAPQSEIAERLASGGREQDRTSERHRKAAN